MSISIRDEHPGEEAEISAIHRAAFGGTYEAEVVEGLRAGGHALYALVAEVGAALAGHVMFSKIAARAGGRDIPALVLAPLAVRPGAQDAGVGTALVREGLRRIRAETETTLVMVRGHPTYYPRFGFSAAFAAERVRAPWSGPTYQALVLRPDAIGEERVDLVYPPPFKVT
jgi:putative acetyltransferase